MANDPGPSEWSLRDLAFYLNHAQAGLGKIEQTRGRPSVLTGACAIWLYAYDPQHYADNHPPEDEVTKIIDELRFPRYYIVQGLRVDPYGVNTESFDLCDDNNNWISIVDTIASGDAVPSLSFQLSHGGTVKVAKGIWIGFDLLLAFLRCSNDVIEADTPSEISVRARMIVETAAATFSLLLHSLTRLAHYRISLDLIGFNGYRDSREYDAVRNTSTFALYAPAIQWFAHYGGIAKLSHLAVKHYYARLPNQHGHQATVNDRQALALEVKTSLEYWQNGLKKLVPTPSRGLRSIVHDHSLPEHFQGLANLLNHMDFGVDPSPAYHDAVDGHFSANSPWVPPYPGTPSRPSSFSGSTLTLREPGSLTHSRVTSRAPSPYFPESRSRRNSNQ
ncbi:hypothetical protein JCM5350_003847 [Sporobolomyces pararoseus]